MYAAFFGLSELPFNNTPDPRFFYPTPDHEEALASMIYAVSESKGFMLLTGEVGAGKTLLTKMVMAHFGNRICTAAINHTLMSAKDLLASVCDEFGIPVPADAGTATCVRVLRDFLLSQYAHNVPVVLMIDEAQALPREGFEQLRMLGNLEGDSAKLLQTLIIGQPELRARFQSSDMRQLQQRLFRSFHLPALALEQCLGYIQHRLDIAGARGAALFDDSAVDVVHAYSQGLPRLINTICDNALLSAYSADLRTLDGAFVESVITQMLPIDPRRTSGLEWRAARPSTPAIPALSSGATVTVGPPPAAPPAPVCAAAHAAPPCVWAGASTPVVEVTVAAAAPGSGDVLSQRINQVESQFQVLADRMAHLEHRLSAPPNSAEYAPAPSRPRKLERRRRSGRHRPAPPRRNGGNPSTGADRKNDARFAAAFQRNERRPREAFAEAPERRGPPIAHAAPRAPVGGSAEQPPWPALADLAVSSARRDQQLRRLTSIVRRLLEERRDPPGAVGPAVSAPASEEEWGDSARSGRNRDRVAEAEPTVAAVSLRLEELVHRTRASMGNLRSLIAEVVPPAPASPTPAPPPPVSPASSLPAPAGPSPASPIPALPSAASPGQRHAPLPARFGSPVTALATEVEQLSELVAKL